MTATDVPSGRGPTVPFLELRRIAPGLEWLEDGVLGRPVRELVFYPSQATDRCFALEEESFWFRHRNAVLLDTLRRFPPPGVLVDVGGGSGYVAQALIAAGWQVVLLEPSRSGVRHARARGVEAVICATWQQAGFLPGSLGAVGLFDVLEHVPDDCRMLASIREALRPRGRLYLTVPAHPWLWSSEDVASGHFRRYSRRDLLHCLSRTGFETEWFTHLFWFLALPILVLRGGSGSAGRSPETRARSEHRPDQPLIRAALKLLCAHERARLSRGRSLPWGSSLLCVARRS